jgi:hypothetical protein
MKQAACVQWKGRHVAQEVVIKVLQHGQKVHSTTKNLKVAEFAISTSVVDLEKDPRELETF